MLTRVLILLVSLLAPLGAQAAVYAENCADTVTDSRCVGQSIGTTVARAIWDGVTPFAPPGLTLVLYTNQVVVQAAVVLTPAQIAANLASAGVTITSTGTPAVSGTYGLDPNTQAVMQWVLGFGPAAQSKFPGATALYHLADINGVQHTFPNVTVLQALALAYAGIAAQVAVYATGVGGAPTMSATIP